MDVIENRTFDELNVGDAASVVRTVSFEDVELFAIVSGDCNPAHLDADYAKSSSFQEIVAHGALGSALISAVLGTQLPGPGTIYTSQSVRFRRPVFLGDTVTATVTVTEMKPEKRRVVLDCIVKNQNGETVMLGTAEVIAPAEKVRRAVPKLPKVVLVQPEASDQPGVDKIRSVQATSDTD